MISIWIKFFWITGNVLWGVIGFYIYLTALLWGWDKGNIMIYPIAAIIGIIFLFLLYNLLIIGRGALKKWGQSIVIFLGSAVGAVIIHGILQNTILE
ncbi:hypothetical protein RZN22_17050 [Bacillaceae bacterium S4-13-58]